MLQKEVEDLEKELRNVESTAEKSVHHSKLESDRRANESRESLLMKEMNDNLEDRIANLEAELARASLINNETTTDLQQKLDRASVTTIEADKLEMELEERTREHEDRREELERRIEEMKEELDRNRGEVNDLQHKIRVANEDAEHQARVYRESLLESDTEVARLEHIVNDLETALRETHDESEISLDPRVAPIYDRLQRLVDQISGKEMEAQAGITLQNSDTNSHQQVEMLKQSHTALQQLKIALEDERHRGSEVKESLEQEKLRSQLLLKVIRHFKRKLLLAPPDPTIALSHDTPPEVEAY